jgi:murein tripeptide amidase MpaA
MMEGIITFLCGMSTEAQDLRNKFVFKIVPMLNVDGVVNGNNRCNIVGVDLNRRWIDPSRAAHPSIYYYKKVITNFQATSQIALISDFHGHSKNRNIFAYGCLDLD